LALPVIGDIYRVKSPANGKALMKFMDARTKKTMVNTLAKKTQEESEPANKVWRIARFKERYEYRDDKDKKGVLQYTRDFVSAGADAESRHFIDQLAELKEFPNWRTHEGSFVELKRRSADDVYGYRGYLLHKHQPADTSRIARWLGCSVGECQETLNILAEVGLIELVDVPDFTASARPTHSPAEQPSVPLPGEIPENPQKSAENPAKRKTTESGNEKQTKTKKTGNPKPENKATKSKISPDSQDAAGGKEQTTEPETRNPNANELKGQPGGTEGSTQTEHQPEPVPVPDDPTFPDDPAGGSLQQGQSPQDVANRRLESTVAIQRATEEFGIKVFTALFHRPPDMSGLSTQSNSDKSEVGCFATAMEQARNLTPQMLCNLHDRSMAEAVALGNKQGRRSKAHNPAAVWRSLFGKFLPAARAGELHAKSGSG
jgi:hypothetical protein